MFSSLLIVTLSLASQVNAPNERYPAPPPSPGSSIAPIGSPPPLTPITGGSTPATSAPPTNTPPRNTASSPGTSPYSPSSRPSNFNSPPATSPINSGAAPASNRQPASSYSPPNNFPSNESASTQPTTSKSSVMMRAMLTPPAASQLRGEPVQLLEVVSTGRTRNEQTQRIEAYWDLCSSVADYYLSVREQDELARLTGSAQSGAAQEAAKKMAIRSLTSLRAAQASQYRLAGFIGRGPANPPLPADLPHCGTYSTRYNQLFAGKSSPEAQVLSDLLPSRFAELEETAFGVASAEDWLRGVISRNENSDAVGNLKALELLALQRRAFVQIARDYNRRIARYSELATPGQITPDRLTGMLIRRPGSTSSTRSVAPPTGRSGAVATSPPPTFVNSNTDDWLPSENPLTTGTTKADSSVKPASATELGTGERSVLVTPQ